MPVYEYLCQDCNDKFEVKASLSEKEKGMNAPRSKLRGITKLKK